MTLFKSNLHYCFGSGPEII